MRDLAIRARQSFVPSDHLSFELLKVGDAFLLRENGLEVFCTHDAEWLTLHLHQRINGLILRQKPDYLLLHSGCGTVSNKRFLMAGDRGAGKTTLLTRLLFEGASVHSDDLVLLKGSEVLPFPRKFHVKEGTLQCIPRMRQICGDRDSYPSHTARFFFFDPTDVGMSWDIFPGRVDAIFCLSPKHSQPSRMRACSKSRAVEKLLRGVENFGPQTRLRFGDLCRMVDRAACFDLDVGDLDCAATLVSKTLSDS